VRGDIWFLSWIYRTPRSGTSQTGAASPAGTGARTHAGGMPRGFQGGVELGPGGDLKNDPWTKPTWGVGWCPGKDL